MSLCVLMRALVTTYAVLGSDERRGLSSQRKTKLHLWQPPLSRVKWHRIVLDESHALRNSGGNWAHLCNGLQSEYRWCMTGTPMAKDVKEIYGQLKFVLGDSPTIGSSKSFIDKVSDPAYCYRLLKSTMIMHGKNQVYYGEKLLADLPAIKSFHIKVPFTATERASYATLHASIKAQFAAAKDWDSVTRLLSIMNPIRRACAFGVSNSNSVESEAKRIKLEVKNNPGMKPSEIKPTHTFTTSYSKITYLLKHLKKSLEDAPDSKALIFTSFSHGVEVVKRALQNEDIPTVVLVGVGGTQQETRRKALEKFNEDDITKVFLMSIRSGGVGINITRANLVYILEPNLNSALEKQAIGRVHRMGQTREVKIFRLIMTDSIEQKVLQYRDEVVREKKDTNPLKKKRKIKEDEDGDEQVTVQVSNSSQRSLLISHLEKFFE